MVTQGGNASHRPNTHFVGELGTVEPSDEQLVTQTLEGGREAFDQLVKRHRTDLVRFIAAVIWDADEAENLAQEALVRSYEGLANYKPDGSFRNWLFGIARNLCLGEQRRRHRHAKPSMGEELDRAQDKVGRRRGALSLILNREFSLKAEEAIGNLPEALREAFVLHYIEQMDYTDISQLVGVPAGTLRVRAHRARAILKTQLGSIVDTWEVQPAPRGP